jgi:membrane associated rhomboid family serine protease
MRDAAVGFQCPSCVAEGAKQTRQARTAYGGRRSGDPTQTTIGLISINVAVWLLIMSTGGSSSAWLDRLALLASGRCDPTGQSGYYPGATQAECVAGGVPFSWVPGVADGAWWQLVTSMFTHELPIHVAFNMLALWFLGPQLELAVGRVRFLALYLLSGLAGSAMVYTLAGEHTQTIGASGAIFGLMGALLVIAHKVGGNVQQILMWIGLNFVITVVGRGFISWQGHLGGFLGGLVIAAILVYAPKPRRTTWQAVGLVAVLVLTLAALVARTVALAG